MKTTAAHLLHRQKYGFVPAHAIKVVRLAEFRKETVVETLERLVNWASGEACVCVDWFLSIRTVAIHESRSY
jgi:hypothetical protein